MNKKITFEQTKQLIDIGYPFEKPEFQNNETLNDVSDWFRNTYKLCIVVSPINETTFTSEIYYKGFRETGVISSDDYNLCLSEAIDSCIDFVKQNKTTIDIASGSVVTAKIEDEILDCRILYKQDDGYMVEALLTVGEFHDIFISRSDIIKIL